MLPDKEFVVPLDPRPNMARDQWRTAKTKYAATLTTKKVKFAQDLGLLLDQRATQHAALDKLGLQIKNSVAKQKLKETERKGTDKELTPAQRTAEVKRFNAVLATRQAAVKAGLKALGKHALLIEKVANQYKVKVKGLGNPAEHDLDEMLDFVIGRAQADITLANRFG